MHRARNIVLVIAFLAVLLAPAVGGVFHLNPLGKIDEKRVLAKKPEVAPWSREGLRQLPILAQAWDKYFSENFGFRKLLIGTYRLATFYVLRTSPNPAVVRGESDGERRWLYFDASVTKDGVGLESILGQRPYIPAELAAIAEQLRQASAAVSARGAKLVIAVYPDKQTIYPEYLPRDKRPRPGTVSRLDQFWAMAADLGGVALLDLRAPLLQAKAEAQLYYPSDTHWNWRAGLLAYQAMARAIERQDAQWSVLPVAHVRWVLGPPLVGDLMDLMGVPAIGGDRDWLPVVESPPGTVRPKHGKLLVITDSFFELVQPFFALQFEQIKKLYRTRDARRTLLTTQLLDTEKPDVVMLASVERYWTMD